MSARKQENSQSACDVSHEKLKEEQQQSGNEVFIRRIFGKIGKGLSPRVDNSPETLSKNV